MAHFSVVGKVIETCLDLAYLLEGTVQHMKLQVFDMANFGLWQDLS